MVIDQASPRRQVEGTVTAEIKNGEAFLRGGGGAVYRLVWPGQGGQATRDLAAGSYVLVGFRVCEGDWFISTAGGTQDLEVQRKRLLALPIGSEVKLEWSARRKGEDIQLSAMLRGQGGLGLSAYRGGERLELKYELLDADGSKLADGALAYG